ncbi:hypothetical protein ACIA8K_21300 [Catenuloplanes sp. NPDC051500]|uniref:hypothetical protein n=1 Tax=Catenuloplanes sp. NPDC051500 TaxID=3363959 RepID=UPI00379E2897
MSVQLASALAPHLRLAQLAQTLTRTRTCSDPARVVASVLSLSALALCTSAVDLSRGVRSTQK